MKMYILVNKDVKMGKGKMAAQVGHAINVYIYRLIQEEKGKKLLEEYMNGEIKKIILYENEENLKKLESLGYLTIRDKGYTQIEPNSLTCTMIGILGEKDKELEIVKDLKLV